MQKTGFESCGRSMRWYEWLFGLLLLGLAAGARADAVYRCTDTSGHVAYQAQSCAAAQAQAIIEISPAPAYAPSPHYAVATERARAPSPVGRIPRRESRGEAYECRASDGRVFYRLAGCPRSIAGNEASGRKGGRSANSVNVSAHRVAREDACMQMHRAGAIGRNGHEFDEVVSTYERDLGRDPCRSRAP